MDRSRLFIMGAVVLGVLAIPATSARAATNPHTPACTDSWKAAVSGLWSVGANWSNGQIPTGTDDVCITMPGTYTVTLAPWSIGTADPNNAGANVHSITIGEASGVGTQTLDIAGQGSTSNSNEQVSTVFLNLAVTSTINVHGSLVLDSTDGGSTLPGNPRGGYAAVFGAAVLNYGGIVTEVQDFKNKYANSTQFEAPLINEPSASVHDSSGLLEATAVTNKGSFSVATRASLSVVALQGVYGAPASFTNDGKLVNNGTITANQGAGTVTWTQSGPIKGNEVTLQGGVTLVDVSGAGQFLMDWIAAKLTGTIPAGQTITVVGEAYNSAGDNYNGTTLELNGHTVVNHGTLILEAQGLGNKTGGPAVVNDGSIRNEGSIVAEVHDPSWTVQFQAGLDNTRAGTVTVTGGTFNDEGGGTVANDGGVKIGPRAVYLLEGATSFSNKKDGTVEPQIASQKSFGQFVVGSGKFIAGGGLVPRIIGAKPAANSEFRLFLLSGGAFAGTFAHVGSQFTADYGHESASPAFVGAIYDKSGRKTKG